jgi:DNA-binding response OmpR family regulator
MSTTVVLAVGMDAQLLRTRRMLLQSAGYIVATALSMKEAFHLFVNGDFDLVILCHTIPEEEKDGLICMIRASGSLVPVFAISTPGGQSDFFADATLETDPPKFLDGIRTLLTEAAY